MPHDTRAIPPRYRDSLDHREEYAEGLNLSVRVAALRSAQQRRYVRMARIRSVTNNRASLNA